MNDDPLLYALASCVCTICIIPYTYLLRLLFTTPGRITIFELPVVLPWIILIYIYGRGIRVPYSLLFAILSQAICVYMFPPYVENRRDLNKLVCVLASGYAMLAALYYWRVVQPDGMLIVTIASFVCSRYFTYEAYNKLTIIEDQKKKTDEKSGQ